MLKAQPLADGPGAGARLQEADGADWAQHAACRDTVLRCARHQDLQQYAAMAALFTEQAELLRPDGSCLQGRAAILAAYQARPSERLTRHLVLGTLVDLLPATAGGQAPEAQATSQVLLWRADATDAPGPWGRPAQGPAVVGEFQDRLQRGGDGRWRIHHRQASFLMHGPLA